MTIHACVIQPYLKKPVPTEEGASFAVRDPEYQLNEAVNLTQAIARIEIIKAEIVPLSKQEPGTLLTKGHLESWKDYIKAEKIDLVVVNYSLTPIQQRNLERLWKTKVIDRTGLILEIFGARANTKEGKLQVELAALTFQRSRLVRSWTHLERQRGGLGFVGGPGETQIEIDRRLISEKINKLKEDLEKVRKTRKLQRKARSDVPYPIVALVGYTNAGKSTLFNTMTGADVFAKDLLFATLDTTMRAVDLESHLRVILSDTVGFISDLPTHLVAAFRATLEEVEEADIILHVRDIAHPQTEAEKTDVEYTLGQLGIEAHDNPKIIEVWNKIDLLDETERKRCQNVSERQDNIVALSALEDEGLDILRERLIKHFQKHFKTAKFTIDYKDGDIVSWIYDHCAVIKRDDQANGIFLEIRTLPAMIEQIKMKLEKE
jgi:GTP-binding protein HflX